MIRAIQYIVGRRSSKAGWIEYIILYRDDRGWFGRPAHLRTIGLDGVDADVT